MRFYDAAGGAGVPDTAPAVMIYLDGPKSVWPQAQIARFAGKPSVYMSVLADPAAEEFDVENGNASLAIVAATIAQRYRAGLWSVVYCEIDTLPQIAPALAAVGVPLLDGARWPWPGCYLHVADPASGVEHLDVPAAPVTPLAVQWLWTDSYDISTGLGTYPAYPLSPFTPEEEETMYAVALPDGKVAVYAIGAGTRAGQLLEFTRIPGDVKGTSNSVIDVTDQIKADPIPYTVSS